MNRQNTIQKWFAVFITFSGCATCPTNAVADEVAYQGELRVAGTPWNGPAQMKFVVIDAATGKVLWSNDGQAPGSNPLQPPDAKAVTLTAQNGVFAVALGNTAVPNMAAIPDTAFDSVADAMLRVWAKTNAGFEQFADQPLNAGVFTHRAMSVDGRVKVDASGIKFSDGSVQATAAGMWMKNGSNTTLTSGNVGIGTNNPTGALHVETQNGGGLFRLSKSNAGVQTILMDFGSGGSTNHEFIMNRSAGDNFIMRSVFEGYDFLGTANKQIRIGTNGRTRDIVVGGDGNVGVGVIGDNPKAKLHVRSFSDIATRTLFEVDDLNGQGTGGTELRVTGASDGITIANSWSSLHLGSAFNGTPNQHTITIANGLVGIGTTSPSKTLDVAGEVRTASGIRFADGSLQTTAGSGGGGYPGPSGVAEITADQNFVVPTGITRLEIELWGGGGGGEEVNFIHGGGSGAYVRCVLAVTPGETLILDVGTGGEPGDPNGQAGTASRILRGPTTLVSAGGGSGASPTAPGSGGIPFATVSGVLKSGYANGADAPFRGRMDVDEFGFSSYGYGGYAYSGGIGCILLSW